MRRMFARMMGPGVLAFALGWALAGPGAGAEDADRAKLAQALTGVGVYLEQGLAASETQGTPISGKFEMNDEGELQLSVYTANGDSFSEVIVDLGSGAIARAEPITGGDDLTAARLQGAAMARAALPLKAGVAKAVFDNNGYRAVSVYPGLEDGVPVAAVTLVMGKQWKTVSEPLR